MLDTAVFSEGKNVLQGVLTLVLVAGAEGGGTAHGGPSLTKCGQCGFSQCGYVGSRGRARPPSLPRSLLPAWPAQPVGHAGHPSHSLLRTRVGCWHQCFPTKSWAWEGRFPLCPQPPTGAWHRERFDEYQETWVLRPQ